MVPSLRQTAVPAGTGKRDVELLLTADRAVRVSAVEETRMGRWELSGGEILAAVLLLGWCAARAATMPGPAAAFDVATAAPYAVGLVRAAEAVRDRRWTAALPAFAVVVALLAVPRALSAW